MSKKNRKKTEAGSGGKIIFRILLTAVAALACLYFGLQTLSVLKNNQELQEKKEQQEQELKEQEERKEELMEQELYVQTQKYIEEKARSLGYVYPDEIIFKEDE